MENHNPTVKAEKGEKDSPSSMFPQLLATLAVTLSAFGMGTVEAFTSPGLPSMEERGDLGHLSPSIQANIASFALFGALLSGPPIGFLMEKVGRKILLMILAVPFVTGWLVKAASYNLMMMYAGRFLVGFCAGAASLIVPIYIGEVAEDNVRGMLSSGFQLMVTIGNLFGYILGTFVNWQVLAAVCGAFPLIGLLLMVWVPRSPRFLLSKGKHVEASASLLWLRGASHLEEIETELKSMEASSSSPEDRLKIKDVFKSQTIKPMMISLLLLMFQQLTGIEAVLMYTVTIFEEAGSTWDPNVCTIMVGSLQVIATFCSAALVDKAGRRKLLILSEVGTTVSMLTLAIFFYFKELDPSLASRMGWIPLLSLGSFIVFFSIGIGPVPFLMLAELNTSKMIGVASAVATSVNWTFAYLVTLVFMLLEEQYGMHVCFAIFTVCSFVGVIFSCVCVPETKGKSMEEIQRYFSKSSSKKAEPNEPPV